MAIPSDSSIQSNGNNQNDIPSGVFTIASTPTEDSRRHNIKPPDDNRQRKQELTRVQQGVAITGACLNVFVAVGFLFSVGALYVDIINIYGASRGEAALIQSLGIGFLFGSGIITGVIVARFGVRIPLVLGGLLAFLGLFLSWFATSTIYLMLSLGVVTGFGSSLIYMASTVLVTTAFKEGRRLALPGLICSAGIGSILFPYLLAYLLAEYGLGGTLLLASGLYLNTIPSGLLMTSHLSFVSGEKNHKHIKDSNKSSKNKLRYLKNPSFLVFMTTAAVGFGTMNSMVVSMLDFVESRGYTTDVGVRLLFIFNTTNTVTRLGAGILTFIPRVHGSMIYIFSLVLCSTTMILMRSTTDYTTILAFTLVFGVGYGGLMGIYNFCVVEFVGPEIYPYALGTSGFLNGVANPLGSSLMGLMYDLTASYELPFLIYGIVGNSAATLPILAILGFKLRRCCNTRVHVIN